MLGEVRHPLLDEVLHVVGGVALVLALLLVVVSLGGHAAAGSFAPGSEAHQLGSFQHAVHLLALALSAVGICAMWSAKYLRRA
jgi:hypothetical protein